MALYKEKEQVGDKVFYYYLEFSVAQNPNRENVLSPETWASIYFAYMARKLIEMNFIHVTKSFQREGLVKFADFCRLKFNRLALL